MVFRKSADKASSLGEEEGEGTTKPPLTQLGPVKNRSWRTWWEYFLWKLLCLVKPFFPHPLIRSTTTQLQLTVIFWKFPKPPTDEANLIKRTQSHIVKNRNLWLKMLWYPGAGNWTCIQGQETETRKECQGLCKVWSSSSWRALVRCGLLSYGVIPTQHSSAEDLHSISTLGKMTQLH